MKIRLLSKMDHGILFSTFRFYLSVYRDVFISQTNDKKILGAVNRSFSLRFKFGLTELHYKIIDKTIFINIRQKADE